MYTVWVNGEAVAEFESYVDAVRLLTKERELLGNESLFILDDVGTVKDYDVNRSVNFETPEGFLYCGGCVERFKVYEALPLNETPPWSTCYGCRGRLNEPTLLEMSIALANAKAGETGYAGEWAHAVLCPSNKVDKEMVRLWLDGDDFNLTDYCGY